MTLRVTDGARRPVSPHTEPEGEDSLAPRSDSLCSALPLHPSPSGPKPPEGRGLFHNSRRSQLSLVIPETGVLSSVRSKAVSRSDRVAKSCVRSQLQNEVMGHTLARVFSCKVTSQRDLA